ncbi:hypothetical protein O181_117859 [Austropuccinia psidii MF-1]|uniref:Guanine nucleotide-binding protein subunit beta-like protein n=1 Tax=Austropuccinia psidii MF-1 TaxID=1389203 RepID=A0A9Q3KBJ1_9BASI|nr:hypothetical protein [Austropuccinia psidii MF-1]
MSKSLLFKVEKMTLRLWDLNTGLTTRHFFGHTKDVLSVSLSVDNRQIVSGSRDPTIKIWNTLGECKFEIKDEGHNGWVSCVRISPNPMNRVNVHAGYLNTVTISPNGYLCASGGKDSITMLWDLNEASFIKIFDLENKSIVDELKPDNTDIASKIVKITPTRIPSNHRKGLITPETASEASDTLGLLHSTETAASQRVLGNTFTQKKPPDALVAIKEV